MAPAKPFATFESTKRFNKAFRALDPQRKKQADKAVRLLFQNPAHPGLETHQIRPDKYYWEAYMNRDERIIYIPEGPHLVLVDIVPHDDIDRYAKAPTAR
ncbi:MAG TPA: hypothetical protein VHG91_21075 [Longimicrobium sp.]|nr:hypothetical protein [Longimicrobium sp.]